MFELFTEKAIRAIMLSQEEARRLGHNLVGTEQVLLGVIRENTSVAAQVLTDSGVTLEAARAEAQKITGRGAGVVPTELPFTPKVKRVFDSALQEARQLGQNYIAPEHLLLAIASTTEGVATRVLMNLGVEPATLRDRLMQSLAETPVLAGGGRERASAARTNLSTLEEFGTNLTQQAIDGKLDPMVGRQQEIERVVQILGRRTKNNPDFDRRTRRGQNRDRGWLGATDRRSQRSLPAGRQAGLQLGHGNAGGRDSLPGRI